MKSFFGLGQNQESDQKQNNLSTLQNIDDIRTAKDFLEQCTYFIGLTDLYQVHSTCYYNETMPYCPLQVKIAHEEIKKAQGGAQFLLQVWKRGGKKVFERLMQDQVQLWTVSYKYFIYQPSVKDEDNQYLHIVDFSNDGKVHKIKAFADRTFKFAAFSGSQLFLGNHNSIKVLHLDLNRDNSSPLEVSEDDIFTIKLENENLTKDVPCRLLGLLVHRFADRPNADPSVITCIESTQSIVDFSFLNVKPSQSVNSSSRYEYTLNQYREIITSRDYTKEDRIYKFEAVIPAKTQFIVGVAQRESGSFDIYYNAFRVSSSGPATVHQVDMSFDTIYLLMRNDTLKDQDIKKTPHPKKIAHPNQERVRAIHTHWENKMNFQNSEYDEHYTMKNIFFQRIKNHCKLFNSFNLLGTVLAISHGKMMSIYSILSQKWVKHFAFSSEVVALFRSPAGVPPQITILTADNQLKVVKADRKLITAEDQEPWVIDQQINLELPRGKISQHAFDYEDNKWVLFLIKIAKRDFHLIALYENKLYDVSSQIKKFGEKTNLFFLYSVCENTEFIIQYGKKVMLYEILMEEDVPEEEKKRREHAKMEVQPDDDENDDDKPKKHHKEEFKTYEFKPVIHLKQKLKVPEIQHRCGAGVKFRLHKFHEADDHDEATEGVQIHKEHYYLIMGDYHNYYKIDLEHGECKVFPDQNTIGIYFSDNNYLYTLSHRSNTKRAGFRLYDIENVVEQNKDYSYTLSTNVQVGCQGYIDFSPANQRIVFQASYEKIEVVPVLHRNTVNFIGMRPRNYFLATKVIDGIFYALSIKGKLFAWDVVTGKTVETQAPIYKDLAEYEIYQWDKEKKEDKVYKKEWYSKILLRKKTPIPNFDEKAYFASMRDHSIKGQVSYLDMQSKSFYEFKLIEIVSGKEVKEHLRFVHPYYNGIMQHIYFSADLTYMLERLKYDRSFLYVRKDEPNGSVQWMYRHRFQELPNDLMHITQYPFIFSPNFTRYIDIDNSHNHFIIRDTLNNEQFVVDIPQQLMSSKTEKLEDIAKRFKWVDEDIILVVNTEGIERLVDITKNFEEIQFNGIPLFDINQAKGNHYILDSPPPEESDTLARLQRRYQAYKSAYYLQNKRDNEGRISQYHLYNSLFTVDYRIEECNHRYVAEMSFTFLHWTLMEQLRSGKLTLNHIDLEQIEHLFYQILPGGTTILHYLHDRGDTLEQLMKLAHERDDKPELVIHVPFLQNMEEKSPVHLCSESTEYRYINMFLEHLELYSIDHHSRALADEYHTMIEHSLPNFIPYLESRVLQTSSVKSITKGMLKVTNKHHVCAASFWHSQQDIDQLLQPAPIEQDIKLSFWDVPGLHDFVTENGINFFEQLAETEQMALFETHGIKKLIEFKWPLIFKYTVLKLFIPFLVLLTAYLTYMHMMIYTWQRNIYEVYLAEGVLVVFSLYLLGIEAYQMALSGVSYFVSFWNYLDFIPPTMLIIFIGMANFEYFQDRSDPTVETVEACMQATMSLMLWLKMLYFLRIFKTTGYLIRIIIEVVVDMRHFLFILLLTFIAFGDAMYNINTSNQSEFIEGGYLGSIAFVYRMVLGDFDTGNFGSVAVPYMWILFLLCTVFNMIIMLNLLIAIISESFARINEEREQAGYQEKASFISENLYLVPKSERANYCLKNRYLLFAVDAEEELAEHVETVDEKLHKLKAEIFKNQKKMTHTILTNVVEHMKEEREVILKSVLGENYNHNHGHTHASGHATPSHGHGHH